MAMERTVPGRPKSALFGQISVAIKALGAVWFSGERETASHNCAEFDPAPDSDALHTQVPRIEAATAPEMAEIAQVISPLLNEMQHIVSDLAAHAELAGEASGQLAAMSRRSRSSAQGVQSQASDLANRAHALGQTSGDAAGIAPDMRSESAFLSGAAQTLESSIDAASKAITELAVAIASAAATAASGAAVAEKAEKLAQQANATLGRLCHTTRQINEIVAYIHTVALPANLQALDAAVGAAQAAEAHGGYQRAAGEVSARAAQAEQVTSDIHAIARAIIEGADEARQLMDDVGRVIARMRDAMLAIAAEAADPADAAGGSGPPRNELARWSINYRS